MRLSRRSFIAAAALPAALPAFAQPRTIRLVVPYPPGATMSSGPPGG